MRKGLLILLLPLCVLGGCGTEVYIINQGQPLYESDITCFHLETKVLFRGCDEIAWHGTGQFECLRRIDNYNMYPSMCYINYDELFRN